MATAKSWVSTLCLAMNYLSPCARHGDIHVTLPALPARPGDLPNYQRPPVDEVVIAVQFLNVPGIEALAGEYRETVKERYPIVQYQPRLPPPPAANSPQPTFIFAPALPTSIEGNRIWLVSQDETSLIQLQGDRFVHNWRYRGVPYPRFEAVYAEFAARFCAWRQLVHDRGPAMRLQLQQLE